MLGEFEEGLSCINEAMKISPSDSEVWNHKGIYFYSLRQYDEAIKCFSKATDLIRKTPTHGITKAVQWRILARKKQRLMRHTPGQRNWDSMELAQSSHNKAMLDP